MRPNNGPRRRGGAGGTTGRHIVYFKGDDHQSAVRALQAKAGVSKVAYAADFKTAAIDVEAIEADLLYLNEIGAAVLNVDPARAAAAHATSDMASVIIEPERVVYATSQIVSGVVANGDTRGHPLSVEYLRGWRDSFDGLLLTIEGGAAGAVTKSPTARLARPELTPAPLASFDEADYTWGLQATNVDQSPFSGVGVRVAILDTGLDFNHPDFGGRSIQRVSFISGSGPQDGHGHGTHTAGTAGGTSQSTILPRYGIASDAELFIAKVLSDEGSGSDSGILAGINWAVGQKAHVVSMSLGGPVQVGAPYSRGFELVARRALARGTLVIAAAGNDSRRNAGLIMPVSHPANCPSIMAVAAIDANESIAYFSNGGIDPRGGQIDIAGPGVDVYSSFLMPDRYRRLSGTSMATPHVSGIAALYAEALGVRGEALWLALIRSARRLPLPSRDVGSGLVQAPVD